MIYIQPADTTANQSFLASLKSRMGCPHCPGKETVRLMFSIY